MRKKTQPSPKIGPTYRLLKPSKTVEVSILGEDADAITTSQPLPVDHLQVSGSKGLHFASLDIAEGDALVTKLESNRHLRGKRCI